LDLTNIYLIGGGAGRGLKPLPSAYLIYFFKKYQGVEKNR
jgi:hypothetical protein